MIDTIKLSVPFSKESFRELVSNVSLKHTTTLCTQTPEVHLDFVNGVIRLPSSNRNITIFIDKLHENVYIEFSIPKYFYGHNVYLFYFPIDELIMLFDRLYKELLEISPSFPHYDLWDIQRLDVCYAWKFPTKEISLEILAYLKTFQSTRKDMMPRDTGVMAKGRTYSTKFYLKEPEFFKNDFHVLVKVDEKLAFQALEESEGVLRFEATLRKMYLRQKFPQLKRLTIHDVSHDKIFGLLRELLAKYLRYSPPVFTDSTSALRLLKTVYSKQKAIRLFSFYKLYNSSNELERYSITSSFDRRTIWKNKKDLAKAGVGIIVDNPNLSYYNLEIPSDHVVNSANV